MDRVSTDRVFLGALLPFIKTLCLLAFCVMAPCVISVSCTHKMGSLDVTIDPVEAEIFLDGNYVGRSEMSSHGISTFLLDKIPIGPHKLTITRLGYNTYTHAFSIEKGRIASLSFSLDRETGMLEVVTEPTGAQVFLDEREIGKSSLFLEKVGTGEHDIKVTLSGYKPESRKVNIVKDSQSILEIMLIQKVAVRWTVETFLTASNATSGSLLFADDLLVLSTDHTIYSFDAHDGQTVWEFGSQEDDMSRLSLLTTPIISDDALYLFHKQTGEDPEIEYFMRVIDVRTGKAIRSVKSAAVTHPPAIAEGILFKSEEYRTEHEDEFYFSATDLKSGQNLWIVQTAFPLVVSPVVSEGVVCFCGEDGIFHALDAKSAGELWKLRLKFPGVVQPLVIKGVVFAGDSDRIDAVDIESGHIRWFFDGVGFTQPAVKGNSVFVRTKTRIYALQKDNGRRIWLYNIWQGEGAKSSPRAKSAPLAKSSLVVGDHLYFNEYDRLYALNTLTGDEEWQFQVNGSIQLAPVFNSGVLYFTTDNGMLFALETVVPLM